MKPRRLVEIILTLIILSGVAVPEKRPMSPEDLYQIKAVSDPQVSPDGKWIAYTIAVPDLAKNRYFDDIWLVPTDGGVSKPLTTDPENDYSPRWSPDGKQIAFISERNGTPNLFLISLDGGEAKQVTFSETGLYSPIWSNDGKRLICGSRVLPAGKNTAENWTKNELPECNARTIDRLLFRQWDTWLGDERNHVFLVNPEDGAIKDLTPGDFDTPPVSLSSSHDFDISPDGAEICYTKTEGTILAVSTNHDLFTVDIPTGKTTKITSNPALDGQPHYSPDGRYIAYTSMTKVNYESDREVLTLYEHKTGKTVRLTENLDRSVGQILWSPDSRQLFFTAEDQGHGAIYAVDLSGNFRKITDDGFNTHIDITPDGETLVFQKGYNHKPYEIYSQPVTGEKPTQLTWANREFDETFDLPQVEEFWFPGANNDMVHGFLLRPPHFDPKKKYPVVLTIHGGPQNMWGDRFMLSWFTMQLIASPGYVGVFINQRGSTGYSSKFREEVSRDYGGKCYEDLVKGLDFVIAKYGFIDKDRQAVIGGSFGGYSVNWLIGHTNRFKCAVSHAGLYNLTSFYGATEELWYPAWDEPELYDKWSPHRFAKNFRTPTLVTQGELDFRVPVGESLQLFTALQRQGVPSRLVIFPDEGHEILGLQNNVRWWKEMHRWLAEYLK